MRPQQLQKKNWTNQEGILRFRWSATLWAKNLAETIHFWLMGSERKSAGFLAKNFQRSCQHRIPYVLQRKASRQTGLFQKKLVWHSFLILNEELPDLWQKFSTMVSKTKSMWPEELFCETFFGWRHKFISFDGFSEEILICKKTPGSSVRHSTRPVEHSKGQISGRNKTFRTFGHWARVFWVSG